MRARKSAGVFVGVVIFGCTSGLLAQDWPQWRGPNRDGKVSGFVAPAAWPKQFAQKWKVNVGFGGDSTPALVGDRLYISSRQGDNEVTLCLSAADGKEIWRDQYPSAEPTGNAGGPHKGPRCTPAVADGKVVTVGATGIISCYTTDGKMLWRKDEFQKSYPRFFVASSPLVVNGTVIAALGAADKGGLYAYDLTTGQEKWKWTGDGPAYSSPNLMDVDGVKQIVVLTDKKLIGLSAGEGKLLFELPFAVQGRGYNVATPIIDGKTLIYTGIGRGTKAIELSKEGDAIKSKELWSNPDVSVQFCTPVLKDGLLYGVSDRGTFFCINAKTGATAWTDEVRRQNYGAMLDVGPVILALTQKSQLSVIQPNEKAYTELASIKVADSDTFAHPVVSGKRIFIRDQDSVMLYAIE